MRRQRRPDAGATQRCLNPGFSERIENSRRTTVHGAHKSWTEARGGIECVKEAENGSSTRTHPVRAWRVSGADRSTSWHPPSTRGGHNVDTGLDARAGATQVHQRRPSPSILVIDDDIRATSTFSDQEGERAGTYRNSVSAVQGVPPSIFRSHAFASSTSQNTSNPFEISPPRNAIVWAPATCFAVRVTNATGPFGPCSATS
jgi:hypothetical protein